MMPEDAKTIDELVGFAKCHNGEFSDRHACYSVIKDYTSLLIDILKSKKNPPSKYDLTLVNEIIQYKYKGVNHQIILNLYKDIT